MPLTTTVGVAAVAVLLCVSAFFSSTEIALFSLPARGASDGEEDDGGEEGDGERAEALELLLSDPHRLLVTVLVGNNVVNVAVSSIVTLLVAQRLSGGAAAGVATAAASLLVLVFGEIIPKSYGLGNADEWAVRVARPMVFVSAVLYPVVFVFDGVTRRMSGTIGGDAGVEKAYEE